MAGSIPGARAVGGAPRLVTRLVLGLDQRLRRAEGVFEFSDDEGCLFRIQRRLAARGFRLSDGVEVSAGDPLIELHFWNEHLFACGGAGSGLSWARRMRLGFQRSLTALTAFLDARAEFDGYRAVFGDLGVTVAARNAQLRRVCSAYGFEPVEDGHKVTMVEHMHRAGQNTLGLLLTVAVNPASTRLDVLARDHERMAISRAELRRRYGAAAARRGSSASPLS